eukprot:901891-Amphidinium_carterae.1
MDFSSAQGESQFLVRDFLRLLGTPFASHKAQPMTSEIDFLGVTTDLSRATDGGFVLCWPRQRLLEKVRDLIADAITRDSLTPAQAAKIRGILTFTSHAMSGKVGRAAMGPIKQRQYHDVKPWRLSSSLKRSFEFFEVLFEQQPRRRILVRPIPQPILI